MNPTLPRFLAALSVVATSFAFAQTAPAIPAKSGEAAGTLQAGKTTVTLKHAYARGPVAAGNSNVYYVMLTDGPVAADQLPNELRVGGGQGSMRSGKLSGVFLVVASDGFVRTLIPFIGTDSLRGGSTMASVGNLDSFKVTDAGVTGQGKRALADTMGQGWSYGASFNAALIKP